MCYQRQIVSATEGDELIFYEKPHFYFGCKVCHKIGFNFVDSTIFEIPINFGLEYRLKMACIHCRREVCYAKPIQHIDAPLVRVDSRYWSREQIDAEVTRQIMAHLYNTPHV